MSLSILRKRLRPTLVLYLALTAVAIQVPATARANPVEAIRFGLLDHATTVTSSGIENGIDLNIELLFDPAIVPFHIPGSPYVAVGASFNGDARDTDQLYGQLTWELPITERIFAHVSGGLAIHDGELHHDPDDGRRALGQRVLLRASLEIGRRFGQHHALAIVYDHISNGPFGGSNQGIDELGVRYSYRFR